MCHRKGFSRYGSKKDAVPSIPTSALVNKEPENVPRSDPRATEYTEEYCRPASAVDKDLKHVPEKKKQR